MRDTYLSLKLQSSKGRLFDAFKKAEHKAKSEEDSGEKPQKYLISGSNLLHSIFANCEVYFIKTMVYNIIIYRLYPHKPHIERI